MSAEATGWVWKHSPYKGHHAKFLIHLAVADVVNDAHGNEFWMSQKGLAEKVGVSRQSVCEWFHDATDRGLVECVRDNSTAGRPNVYRFLMPKGVSPQVTGGVGKSDRGVSAQPTGGVGSADTELKGTQKGTQTSLSLVEEVDESATADDSSFTSSAKKVFEKWTEATGKDPKKVKLNRARQDKIRARLREGYSVDDLCAAVQGIALSAWHTGDNPDGKRYDDITVALRDGAQVEKFRDLYEQGGERGRGSAASRVLAALNSNPSTLGLPAGEA